MAGSLVICLSPFKAGVPALFMLVVVLSIPAQTAVEKT